MKVDASTKSMSHRTKDDYFTYELDVSYCPHLDEKDNIFSKFLHGVWEDEEEYQYFKLINGKLLLPAEHSNLLIVWHHEKGGGGKTIWVNSIQQVLGPRVTQIDREILYRRTVRNKQFELARLRGRTMAYVDEVADKDTKNSKESVNLKLLLDLSGGA